MLKLDLKNSSIRTEMLEKYADDVEKIHKYLRSKVNDEGEFLGWIELPTNYDRDEFERIKKAAKKIQSDSDVLVVIGIGGSYLGARAVIEAMTDTFNNSRTIEQRKFPQVVYAGNNLSPVYLNDLLEYLSDNNECISS